MKFNFKKMLIANALFALTFGVVSNANNPTAIDEDNCRKLILMLKKKPLTPNDEAEIQKKTSAEAEQMVNALTKNEKAAIIQLIIEDLIADNHQSPWCAYVIIITLLLKSDSRYKAFIAELEKHRNSSNDLRIMETMLAIKANNALIPDHDVKKQIVDKVTKCNTSALAKVLKMRADQNKNNQNITTILENLKNRLKQKVSQK